MKPTEDLVALALATSGQLYRQQCCIPNISWGLYPGHECDFISFTPGGVVTEYEIKTSWRDWRDDPKKDRWIHVDRNGIGHKRQMPGTIGYFYYVVPKQIYDEHVTEFESPLAEAGYVVYEEVRGKLQFRYLRRARKILGSRVLTPDEKYRFARLGVIRYWTRLRELHIKIKYYEEAVNGQAPGLQYQHTEHAGELPD